MIDTAGGYGRGWMRRRQFLCGGARGYGRGRCFRDYPPPGFVAQPGSDVLAYRREEPYGRYPELRREDELRMLEEEEQMLRLQLDEVLKAIEALKKEIEKEV